MDGMKLAGPAAGSYDGGQKMSTQKRKRDKAQEQLRTRMRQRINGNGASSTLIHSKRRSTLLDGKGDISLSASLGHSSTMEVAAKDLQGGNYWRTQQDRLNAFQNSRSPRISKNQTVPLQELVDRVLHRKEQNFGLGTKASPMTIRAYKTPVAPYAIQQSSLVKKMVMMKPIQRQEREDKGPFVLVLQREEGEGMADSARSHRRLHSDTMADSEGQSDTQEEVMTMSSAQVLPPVNSSKTAEQSQVELKTWRPPLDGMRHQPAVLPEAEDRSVTNYRLQLQHANKLAESRFEFPNRDTLGMPSHKSVEEMTMQSLNPLPPIQSVLSGGDTKETNDTSQAAETTSSTDNNGSNRDRIANTNVNNSPAVRTSSKDEILNMKKAHKEAKRQKQSEEEFTLLRTRKRFTSKTKQFKNELQRARQLSAIQEDRSSLGSARLSRLSGRKATLSSASSASSLRSIDESNVSRQSTDTGDVEEKSAEPNRSDSEQSNHTMPAAPPTTPSLDQSDDHDDADDADDGNDDESMDQEGAVSETDVVNTPHEDSEESGEESMEEVVSANTSDESITSDSSPSTSDVSEEAPENVPRPVVVQEGGILDDITWIEGDVPFSESAPSTQADPVSEHGR